MIVHDAAKAAGVETEVASVRPAASHTGVTIIRDAVYTDWLKVARGLVGPPGGLPPSSKVMLPDPSIKARLNDLTRELELVASPEVGAAVNAYLRHLDHPSLVAEMARPASSMDEMVDRFQKAMKEYRRTATLAMRRDLGTTRRGRRV